MTPGTAARQSSLSFIIYRTLLKLMSIGSVMPSNQLILCRPLLCLPSTSTRIFSNESSLCIRWPKYWRFSFSISPSSNYLGLVSFRTGWFDLLTVQRTLESSPASNSKESILGHSAFFRVQLSHLNMTIRKTIAVTLWTFVGSDVSAF